MFYGLKDTKYMSVYNSIILQHLYQRNFTLGLLDLLIMSNFSWNFPRKSKKNSISYSKKE